MSVLLCESEACFCVRVRLVSMSVLLCESEACLYVSASV